MQRLILAILAMAFTVLAGASANAAQGVALTFDDLPTIALSGDPAYAQVTTRRLLAGLRRHHLPATGFVIGERLDGPDRVAQNALVTDWLDAGMAIGNHTYAHLSLNKTPVDDYIADVSRADALLRPLLAARHRPLRWFRHPYLETGRTLETRRAFEAWLAGHGYRVAPVTMDGSDYVFALPYDDAVLRGDAVAAARVRQAYLDHTQKVVAWYRTAARQLLGRPIPLVFLLHASRLNADSLDQIDAILRHNGLHAISLDRAIRDRAYRITDAYAGPDGDDWLNRWAGALHKDLPWDSFPEPPADIVALNDRLDTSP